MTARNAAIMLSVGGADLLAKIDTRHVNLTLTENREDDADELQLRLANADGRLELPETGAVLTLAMGWGSGPAADAGLIDKGSFKVDEVGEEGAPDTIIITARSADMTAALRKLQTQIWKDTTLGDVLQSIAARHDAQARIGGDLAARPISAIEQEGRSDMAFIRDLGKRYDAIATWKAGLLLFSPIAASASAGGTALDRLTLTRRDGGRWTFNQAERDSYDGAEAQWHDQNAGRRRTVTTGGTNRRKLKRVYATEAEARQAADASAGRAGRAGFKFTFELAVADMKIQPDMRVTLSGWRPRIDAIDWLVSSVTSTYSASGLTQSIEMESA